MNSYHDLAFGKAWDDGEPHEQNLHVTLQTQGFPKGFAISAILLRVRGNTEGANDLLRSAPTYVKLIFSVPWLDTYFKSHLQEIECMFYVHGKVFHRESDAYLCER